MSKNTSAAETLRKNLRYWRQERRLTLRTVASALGVSAATLSDYERGVRSINIERLAELADLLDVEVGTLFQDPPLHYSGEISTDRRRK